MEKKKQEKSLGYRITTVIGIVLCVIFIPLILLNTVLIVRSFTDKDHIASVFGIAPVIVLSGSMEPTFSAGDMIFVQKTDPATLQEGDVICYLPEESEGATAVTHRIMEVQQQDGERVFITKGDFNTVEDRYPVKESQVQGKYMEDWVIAGLGNVAVFLQSPLGMVIFIACPVALFLLWDLLRRALENRKRGGETAKLQAELARLRAQVGEQEKDNLE